MSTEIAMLLSSGIAAVIAAGAPLLTLLITRKYDARSEKQKENERFFYEIFPKRMQLYDDILQATEFLSDNEKWKMIKTKEDAIEYFNNIHRNLIVIAARCRIFASDKVAERMLSMIEELSLHIEKTLYEPFRLSLPFNLVELTPLTETISKAKIQILELIREESCTKMIDRKLADFLMNFKSENHMPNNICNNT